MRTDFPLGRFVIRRFAVRCLLLVILSAAAVWQFTANNEAGSNSVFVLHVPPLTNVPTKEQIVRLPNSDEYLHVTLSTNGSVSINNSIRFEGDGKYSAVGAKLGEFFDERVESRVLDEEFSTREDLPIEERVARKAVIIAPATAKYGEVVSLIDAVKTSGFDDLWIQTMVITTGGNSINTLRNTNIL